jgi:hypothetical protein
MVGLLHIYDADDPTTNTRSNLTADYTIGVRGGADGLIKELDGLLSKQMTFANAVFTTHGSPGAIWFHGDYLTAWWMRQNIADKGYQRLFLPGAKIYFRGCNCAAGEDGWQFLEAITDIFLRRPGSMAYGHTATGFSLSPWALTLIHPGTPISGSFVVTAGGYLAPVVGVIGYLWQRNKVVHLGGEVRAVFAMPGGRHLQQILTDAGD